MKESTLWQNKLVINLTGHPVQGYYTKTSDGICLSFKFEASGDDIIDGIGKKDLSPSGSQKSFRILNDFTNTQFDCNKGTFSSFFSTAMGWRKRVVVGRHERESRTCFRSARRTKSLSFLSGTTQQSTMISRISESPATSSIWSSTQTGVMSLFRRKRAGSTGGRGPARPRRR